jgi:molecular chaperone HscB
VPGIANNNYFELFGLPVDFDVDASTLSLRYRELARRVHPDKFAQGSDQERRLSMQWTMLVNEAFQTLKDPIRRGRYLLSLAGVELRDETDTAMDPQFLLEQMELREALEAVRGAADPQRRLAELAAEIGRQLDAKTQQFRAALARGTDGRRQASEAIREMQFLGKLLQEVGQREEELA